MPHRPATPLANLGIVAIVVACVAVGIFAVTRIDRSGETGSGLGDTFDYQIEAYKTVDPALVGYAPAHVIPTGMKEARAVAVGPAEGEEHVYVAGDRAVRVFDPGGTLWREIPLAAPPRCLTVAGSRHAYPGRIYVGLEHHVEVLDSEGQPVATWETLGAKALLTSIAVGEADVFVADAGNRIVMRYDTSGHLAGRITAKDSRGGNRPFVVPSPFFDVAVDHGGRVWVADPGALRIECYSPDGDLERFWGQPSAAIEGFFGCCNPAHFALLDDGRFVTAEKGLLRVKIYDADGQFECVVADPRQLESSGRHAPVSVGTAPSAADTGALWDHEFRAVDVAADTQGRVFVLDPATGNVRVFQPKTEKSRDP